MCAKEGGIFLIVCGINRGMDEKQQKIEPGMAISNRTLLLLYVIGMKSLRFL